MKQIKTFICRDLLESRYMQNITPRILIPRNSHSSCSRSLSIPIFTVTNISESRLRARFDTPDTSRREEKNCRRNHRSLAQSACKFASPSRVTHSRSSIIDKRSPSREGKTSHCPLTPPRTIIGALTIVSESVLRQSGARFLRSDQGRERG